MAEVPEGERSGRDWSEFAKGLLRAELKRRNLTYGGLVEALEEIGVKETEANLRNKISRGNFSAAFMLQCLDALGVSMLVLNPEQIITGRRRFSNARRAIEDRTRDPSAQD